MVSARWIGASTATITADPSRMILEMNFTEWEQYYLGTDHPQDLDDYERDLLDSTALTAVPSGLTRGTFYDWSNV